MLRFRAVWDVIVLCRSLATAERRREAVEMLRGQEREEAEWLLKHLDLYEQRIAELKGKIQKEAKTDEDMKRLQTVAGVGPIVVSDFSPLRLWRMWGMGSGSAGPRK